MGARIPFLWTLWLVLLLGSGSAAAQRVRYHAVQHKRLVLGDPADPFIAAAHALPSRKGYFDLVGHGNPEVLGVRRKGVWRDYNAKQLARFVRHAGWNGKDKIRFMSCHVGLGKDSIAEQLSRELKVPVLAPKSYLWIYGNGRFEVQKTLGGAPAMGADRFSYFDPSAASK